MVAVVFILAATLTLLPAVLGRARVEGRQRRPALGALGRAPLAVLRRAGPSASGRDHSSTASPRCSCCWPSPPPCSDSRPACRRSRSSRPATARASATRRCRPRSAPARPAHCSSSLPPATQPHSPRPPRHDPGIAAVMPTQTSATGALRARAGDPAPEPLRPRRRPNRRPPALERCPPARWWAAQPRRTTTSRARSRMPPRSSSASCSRSGSCCC